MLVIFMGSFYLLTMMLSRVFSLILLLVVVGCATPKPAELVAEYIEPGTPGGRLCTAQCKNASNYCQESCDYKERLCVYDVQAQAIKDYEVYVQEQFEQRMTVDLRPSDFERTSQCKQAGCKVTCKKSYNKCFKKCGGSIDYHAVD